MQYNMQKQNTIMLWSSFPSSVFNGLEKNLGNTIHMDIWMGPYKSVYNYGKCKM